MKRAYAKYLASLLIFGMNGIIASQIALSSYEIVFARTMIGSLFLIVVFTFSKQKMHLRQNKRHTLYLFVSGIALGTSWIFLYEAYRQLGVGIASLSYYCGPVIVMALAPVIFREKLTWTKAFGFLIVLIGMLCVNTQALSAGKTVWGLFCGFMSAILYAVMVIFNKKANNITGLENSMGQLTAAFLSVAVFVAIKQGFVFHLEPGDWIPILVLGMINTGIGCYFYFSSIGSLPVQTVSICGYVEPLSAVVFSMVFLHEMMTGYQVIGAILILGGAAFGEFFPSHSKSKTVSTI